METTKSKKPRRTGTPASTIRWDSWQQLDDFKRAAKRRRWSLNDFVIASADQMCRLITQRTENKADEVSVEQPKENDSQLTLNQ